MPMFYRTFAKQFFNILSKTFMVWEQKMLT